MSPWMPGPPPGTRDVPHRAHLLGVFFALGLLAGCGGSGAEPGDLAEPSSAIGIDEPVRFTVPQGAGFRQVTDTLVARNLVKYPLLFRIYARSRGDDGRVRAGPYAVPPGTGWSDLLDDLVAGRVETRPVTIPEGWTLRQIAGRLGAFIGVEADDVMAHLEAEGADARYEVPGPGLEGYLFPDTYRFAPGVDLEVVVRAMVNQYRQLWTPEREARARELAMSEREMMTLASIVQAEARHVSEMPRISAVFHNRLRIGYLLQADPTVQYALGERRSRLLYRDIDAVADNPYNTYTNAGLPPGPIGAAGEAALEATLWPEASDYLYFVARPDGSHIFTRTLVEHNRARVEARRQWDALERNPGGEGGP